jgi:hypothetical protein
MKRTNRFGVKVGLIAVGIFALSVASGTLGCSKKKKESADKKSKSAKEKSGKEKKARPGQARKVEKEAARGRAGARAARAGARAAQSKGPINLSVGLNVAKLRSTFLWKKITESKKVKELLQKEGYKMITQTCKVDPMKDIESVIIGVGGSVLGGSGKKDAFAFVIKGKFDTQKIMTCAKTAMKKEKEKFEEVTVGGKKGLAITTKKKEKVHLLPANKNTMVVASATLSKAAAGADPTFGNPALAQALKKADKSGLLWGAMGAIKIPAGKVPPMLGQLNSLKGGSFSMVPKGDNWKLVVMVDAGEASVAQKLTQIVNMGKMAVAMKGSKGATGSKKQAMELLKKLEVGSQGSIVNLKLAIPVSLIKKAMAEGKININ